MIVGQSRVIASAGPPLTNLFVWLKTPIPGFADTDPLTGDWADSSGNGHTYTFGTDGGNNPIYRTGQVNGLPALNFNTNALLNATFNFSAGDFTSGGSLYVVVKSGASADFHQTSLHNGFGTRGGNNSSEHFPFTDGKIYEDWLANDTSAEAVTPGVTITNWHLYEVIAGTASYNLYQNGGNIFTRASNTLYAPSGTNWGHYATNFVGHFDGWIAEILIYNVAHNSTDRGLVEAYVSARTALF